MVKIGVDAMGGDFAPMSVVLGAFEAKRLLPEGVELYLLGEKDKIAEICREYDIDLGSFVIVHCSQKIEMGEHPVRAYIHKPESSISVGFKMLSTGELDAFASAGSTGAMLVGCMQSRLVVPGLQRPCISIEVPQLDGSAALLLDVGFNADCKAEVLHQFAILGSIYAKEMMGIANPRVALLNIGEERDKGALLHKETFSLLSSDSDINFIGNMESKSLFKGGVTDVIVTDGFTGNVVLKQAEAMYDMCKSMGYDGEFTRRINYEVYGGTPVLGTLAPIMIGHGASSPMAVTNMILQAWRTHVRGVVKKFETSLRQN